MYLLVGVHETAAEAKAAHKRLGVPRELPVRFERNVNGMGKCKTWLAVSPPFQLRPQATVAMRQISLYVGERAVCLLRSNPP